MPTKSYTPVLRHICLNASIPTFLLASCDHPSLLTCTYLALISFSVHACFILQLQQSGIMTTVWNYLPFTLRLSQTLNIFRQHLIKPIFTSLLLIASTDLSSASDSFYWMIMALNQILLHTHLLTYLQLRLMDCSHLRHSKVYFTSLSVEVNN